MGTAVVLGPAAAVAGAGALVAEVAGVGGAGIAVTSVAAGAGPMATAALTAQGMAMAAVGAGPLGWVILGGAVMSGIVIAAGEADMVRPCCWETVIRPDEMNSTNFELQREHGMLLPHLASYCEMFKADDDEKLVLRNSDGEYFAFSITLTVPAGTHDIGPNATHDVTVVHAVPVQRVDEPQEQ